MVLQSVCPTWPVVLIVLTGKRFLNTRFFSGGRKRGEDLVGNHGDSQLQLAQVGRLREGKSSALTNDSES